MAIRMTEKRYMPADLCTSLAECVGSSIFLAVTPPSKKTAYSSDKWTHLESFEGCLILYFISNIGTETWVINITGFIKFVIRLTQKCTSHYLDLQFEIKCVCVIILITYTVLFCFKNIISWDPIFTVWSWLKKVTLNAHKRTVQL
jgi:hypothetical protein